MKQILHLVLSIAVIIGIVATPRSPGAAQETVPPGTPQNPDCSRDCEGVGGVDPEGTNANANGTSVEQGGGTPIAVGPSPFDHCHWSEATAGETVELHPIAGAWAHTFEEDNWLVWCPSSAVVYTFFPVGQRPPPSVIDELIVDAYDRTPVLFFDPQSSPTGTEDIPLITQMRTYLWVDQTLWNQPVTATASLPNNIFSVTTTATAAEATWTGGDNPTTITCDAGTPYQFGIGGDAAQDQTCSTLFEHSSATGDRQLTVSVRWDVSYTCSIGCAPAIPLPSITTTTTRDVLVGEIHAIET